METLALLGFAALALLVLLCVAVFACYHKIRQVHLKAFADQRLAGERLDNLFTQVESLLALYSDLKPAMGLPSTRGWAGSPDFLRHVARVATAQRPVNIVECSSGTSTVVLARVVQLNGVGHVYSLEHQPLWAQKTRDELAPQGLSAFATVLDAPLREHRLGNTMHKWYDTAGLPPQIDMLVVDGPPQDTQAQARYPAVPVLLSRLTPGARVLLDDAARADERSTVQRWQKEFGLVIDQELSAEKGITMLRHVACT
jgi:predicted O-methyltransferase YrrM